MTNDDLISILKQNNIQPALKKEENENLLKAKIKEIYRRDGKIGQIEYYVMSTIENRGITLQ